MKAPSETQLVKACLEYLRLRGVMAWRNNSGATPYKGKDGKGRFVRYGLKGSSDILGVIPLTVSGDGDRERGRFLGVEVKVPGKGPTEDQKQFLQNVTAAGGVALVVHSVDELKRDLDEEGVL